MPIHRHDIRPVSGQKYRLFREGCTGRYNQVAFKDGVADRPVSARVARRLGAAWGDSLVIELWDEPKQEAKKAQKPKKPAPKGRKPK